jgi:hypothetical protein
MSTSASQYFFVVKRHGKKASSIDIFEHVIIEIVDHYRVRCSDESIAHRIQCSDERPSRVSSINCRDQPYFTYFWYDEKYVCEDAFSAYERASELDLPPDVLLWLAGRL